MTYYAADFKAHFPYAVMIDQKKQKYSYHLNKRFESVIKLCGILPRMRDTLLAGGLKGNNQTQQKLI